eukprot:gene11236-13279_t
MAEDAQLRHLVTALNKVKMMKIDPELLRLLHRIELLQQSDRKGTLGHQKELAIMIQHGQKLAEECFAGCLGNLGLQLMELTGEQPPEIPTTE